MAQVDTDFSDGGAVRVGDSTSTCDGTTEGAIRFDADGANTLDYCDGSNWLSLLTSSIGGGDFESDGSVAMTGAIRMPDGTELAPSLVFSDDTTTGLYSPFDSSVNFSTGGSLAFSISDTVIDSKRFHTTSFDQAQVYSPTSGSSLKPGEGIYLRNDSAADGTWSGLVIGAMNTGDTQQHAYLGIVSNAAGDTPDIVIGQQTGANAYEERIRVNSSGNVGIGTTAPGKKLDVINSGDAATQFIRNDNNHNTGGALVLDRRRADATAPNAGFGVGFSYFLEGFTDGSSSQTGAIRSGWENNQTNDTTDRDAYISFATTANDSLSEKMRITSSGNVGVGTTSPDVELDVHTGSINAAEICDENNTNCLDLSAGVGGSVSSLDAADGSPTDVVSVDNDAVIVLGEGDGGSPSNVRVRGPIVSGSNLTGVDLAIEAPNGTGTGGSGSLVFKTAGTASVNVTQENVSSVSQTSPFLSSVSWSHPVGTNSDRLLLVGVASGGTTVSSVTFGAQALSSAGTANLGSVRVSIYYLVNPASGIGTVTVTNSGNGRFMAGSISYFNVDQTTPVSAIQSDSDNSGNNVSVSHTSHVSQRIFDVVAQQSSSGITAQSGQTEETERDVTDIRGLIGTLPGSASITSQYSFSSPWSCAMISVAIFPPGGGGATNPSPMSERMRINESGYVGIGTSSPSHILHITGQGRSTNSAWATTSDARLKNVVGDYPYSLAEIKKINTYLFRYKRDNPYALPSDQDFMGTMAQELMQIMPEAVSEDANGYYTVNTDPIFWALVNATKELSNKCLANDDEIVQLKEENKKLKAELQSIRELLQKHGIE